MIVLLWKIKLNQKVSSSLQEARGWRSWLQLTRAKAAEQRGRTGCSRRTQCQGLGFANREPSPSWGPISGPSPSWGLRRSRKIQSRPTQDQGLKEEQTSVSVRSGKLPLTFPPPPSGRPQTVHSFGGDSVVLGRYGLGGPGATPCHKCNKTVESRQTTRIIPGGRIMQSNPDTEFTDYFIEGQSWKGFKRLWKHTHPNCATPSALIMLQKDKKEGRKERKSDLLKAQGHARRRQEPGPRASLLRHTTCAATPEGCLAGAGGQVCQGCAQSQGLPPVHFQQRLRGDVSHKNKRILYAILALFFKSPFLLVMFELALHFNISYPAPAPRMGASSFFLSPGL